MFSCVSCLTLSFLSFLFSFEGRKRFGRTGSDEIACLMLNRSFRLRVHSSDVSYNFVQASQFHPSPTPSPPSLSIHVSCFSPLKTDSLELLLSISRILSGRRVIYALTDRELHFSPSSSLSLPVCELRTVKLDKRQCRQIFAHKVVINAVLHSSYSQKTPFPLPPPSLSSLCLRLFYSK